MKRIYGYLSRTKHYALRFSTDEPNYMHLPDLEYNWTRIYCNVLGEIHNDVPEPIGKVVTTTTFLDANLLHDLITGMFVTAVLHFFNLTPGNWYSKRQESVQNATYGSEFVAAKTATEQNCRHETNSQVLRSSYQVQDLHVWCPQVCCDQLYGSPLPSK